MELISKVSKGSKMDQIYIPKKRAGLPIGDYVLITPVKKAGEINLFYHNVKTLESIKIMLIKEIFNAINEKIECSNIILTGSFLENGFKFNDIDLLIINNEKISGKKLKSLSKELSEKFNIKFQALSLDLKTLREGLSTDPLYEAMLSRYVSKERLILNAKRRINPKILDLHLIESETLIHNFDYADGIEKYSLIRNLIAISLFLDNKKVTGGSIDVLIKKIFDISSTALIKNNMLNKQEFLKRYKDFYKKTFDKLMGKLNDTKS
ncbi:MAG TPA: hypothetical protein VJB94_03345 [Candidatus Nanoarchaeia archaeon]|nr:hypothetical protein [Candidatus Nanoarchaeia archaeon]